MELDLQKDKEKVQILDDFQELKRFPEGIRNMKKQATGLIFRQGNKNNSWILQITGRTPMCF